MIVADTSALVAVLFGEPERERFLDAMAQAGRVRVSVVSVVEARMVAYGRKGERAVVLLDDMLQSPLFEVVPPDRAQMDAAYAAFVLYGRGSGHPAGLNFGDIFAYALAKTGGLPLLFKGSDFAATDIDSAVRVLPPAAPAANTGEH